MSTWLTAEEVKKPCVDYMKLNAHLPTVLGYMSIGAVTLVDIPKIDEMLARLQLAKCITNLDWRSGHYWIK